MISRCRIAWFLLAALLASCVATRPSVPVPPPAMTQAGYPANLQGARLYRIESAQSRVHILVYRGGTLAQLGHNHVLSADNLSGFVWLHEALERSGFSISLPVNDLIVDEAQARMAEGADFVAGVTAAARAGTRTNMLKPEQLDGEHYPLIRLRSLSITGEPERAAVRVAITIKDRTRELAVPVRLTSADNTLRAIGEFNLLQSEFDIQPYSVAMGAIQVRDQLTIRFELLAVPVS